MKNTHLACLLFFISISLIAQEKSWIRINQLGYLPSSVKAAVLLSKVELDISSFELKNIKTNEIVFSGKKIKSFGSYGAFKSSFRMDFSGFEKEGEYIISAGGITSPVVKINANVYNGTADFLLQYMRQQRCGYNPFLKDSCHTRDGFIVDHSELPNRYIDVKGGWHDASDYLQYVTTSATAAYQLMFAYQKNPGVFSDNFDKDGNEGSNNIPDILDEAKWGLDWLVKMNPDSAFMFNQIADDRDHAGFRLPTLDTITYRNDGMGRPVYFITGKPQGICKYKNRTTGVSSSAAKFASSFALGAKLFEKIYPEFSRLLLKKSIDAYAFALSDLGVCQTASCKSPYFYEEDNYADDLELAAAQLYNLTDEDKYLKAAVDWGKVEPITPWIGADTARHYQWYPFINIGHYLLANNQSDEMASKLFKIYYRNGLDKLYERGKNNPFFIGIPFIWCSNNLVSSVLAQIYLYKNTAGDNKFDEMEAMLCGWLFGCNPWGTSMIVGLPKNGDTPVDPHSAFTAKNNYKIKGGLVDGPIYGSIFNYLIGLTIYNGDEYAEFQSDEHVYHDDYGDYSTNEPTMDGTAGLTIYFSAMEAKAKSQK